MIATKLPMNPSENQPQSRYARFNVKNQMTHVKQLLDAWGLIRNRIFIKAISIDIKVNNMRIRRCTAYGSQESDNIEKIT